MARNCGGLLPTVPAPEPPSAAQGLLAGKVNKAHWPDSAKRKRLWPGDSSGDRWWGPLAISSRLF